MENTSLDLKAEVAVDVEGEALGAQALAAPGAAKHVIVSSIVVTALMVKTANFPTLYLCKFIFPNL